MSKIVVTGDAIVVTSAFTLEELLTIKKYRPNALQLMGGEDNKQPIFAINAVKGGNGGINQYGVTYTGETHDEKKLATLTIFDGNITGDAKEYAAEKIGAAVINLDKLEGTLKGVLEEIKTEKNTVLEHISIQ